MKTDNLLIHVRHTRRVLLTTLQRFVEDGCFNHAAALTYTTLFAIVPLLTVTYSMLSSFPFFHGMGEQLQSFIFSNFVPSSGEVVSQWLTSFSTQARSLTMIGMAFLLGTALMMLRTIDHAINRIFHTQGERRAVTSFLLYWAILSLGPLLIGLGFAASSYFITVKFIHEATTMLGVKGVLLRMMPLFMSALAFTLLYLTVPNRRVQFRFALVGGVTTALLFELAKSGFALLLTLSPTYEFIYGAFAAVPVFLLWIYLSWLLVLLGAELVHSLGEPRSLERGEFSPNLAMVAILSVFHNQFAKGETTMLEQVQGEGWPIGQKHWEQVTSWLTGQGVLGRNSQGALTPAHSFQTLSLASIMSDSPWPQPSSKELNRINLADYPGWFESVVNSLRDVNQAKDKALAGALDTVFSDAHNGRGNQTI
ncbi:YihY family inner membrane protein [Sansalvadorimonas verongulae]|uniref:YihY family inner membrane protein n=1 Tax=Sansalvadorimonas verongulae TaxID=2172824 RepID=UPI0012BD1E37|nr:YihY family inner membrane protein [Sansalvadorimonas verongulae]MTI14772.1 YihY family inner membrane protein [Sansalvadorimonas verongulae]